MKRLLIANRGEIACRIIHTARRMGLTTIAVFSEADRFAKHVELADRSVCIGAAPSEQSYLNISAIIGAATQTQADAIHPGYGFLSENPDFAQACSDNGIQFVGPSAKAMHALGNKAAAKELAQRLAIPVARGHALPTSPADAGFLLAAKDAGQRIGYPLMVKAVAGGGGRGMRLVNSEDGLENALIEAQREAQASFGSSHLLIERAISKARHIEVQVLADQFGHVITLGERDCSTQRRSQKIVEEAPAIGLSVQTRAALSTAAIQLAKAVGYCGAGTVEFLVEIGQGAESQAIDKFYFLEVNTRLQVEHPVTEMLLGIDIVEEQLNIASGMPLKLQQKYLDEQFLKGGHAIEIRLCAEDPQENFTPQAGEFKTQACFGLSTLLLQQFSKRFVTEAHPQFFGPQVRLDSALKPSGEISPWYDSMVAKIIVLAASRPAAVELMLETLDQIQWSGLKTNQHYLKRIFESSVFAGNQLDQLHTRWLDSLSSQMAKERADTGFIQETKEKKIQLVLQAAALLVDKASQSHGALQGFGSLPIQFSCCDRLENNKPYTVFIQCVGPHQFQCSVEGDKTAIAIDCSTLHFAEWFHERVWLTNQQRSVSVLMKKHPLNIQARASKVPVIKMYALKCTERLLRSVSLRAHKSVLDNFC